MAKQRPEKKSETLEVRLPHSKKEAFKQACEAEGITASHAVRTFIDAYLKQSRRVKLKTISQEITMKLFRNPVKTAAAIATSLTAAVLFAAGPSVADTDAFALMDKNSDGFITAADLQRDNDTLEPALADADSNKDNRLDRAEFATLNTRSFNLQEATVINGKPATSFVMIASDASKPDETALAEALADAVTVGNIDVPSEDGETRKMTLKFKPDSADEN